MRALALLWLVSACLVRSAVGQEAPVVERAGKHFVVHCHGGDAGLAEAALAAVEAAWAPAAKLLGCLDQVPAAPLPVHLYRTIAGYVAADRELTAGTFERNLAMTHWASRSAHVALQPPLTDEALRALGLPALTAELLAWEATHLVRMHACPNFRDHPQWFADGLAATHGRAVRETLHATGDEPPTAAAALLRVQRLLADKKLPPATAIAGDRIDDLDLGDRYAARAVFYRFLGSDAYRSKLPKLAELVRGTGGGAEYAATVAKGAANILGSTVDRDFAAFVAKQRPAWREVFRSLDPSGAQWRQIAFPDRNAVAWRRDPVKGGRLHARGTLRILPGGRGQLNFLFGRTEQEDFYSVAFVADQGFTVFRYDGANDDWRNLGVGNAPALRLGVSTDFALEATGEQLLVKVGGQSWTFALPVPLGKEIPWGLGAQAGPQDGATGSAGMWADLVVGAKK
ncbi:MAG: hypothetical protein JNK49_01190 [Planctomycetes bacterium]|nr:hypothetical protein [Planctomycetota bacterium]